MGGWIVGTQAGGVLGKKSRREGVGGRQGGKGEVKEGGRGRQVGKEQGKK